MQGEKQTIDIGYEWNYKFDSVTFETITYLTCQLELTALNNSLTNEQCEER